MAGTQTQAVEITRTGSRFWSARVGFSVVAVLAFGAAAAFAQDEKSAAQEKPSKQGASDSSTKSAKSSTKSESASKGEKSWGSDYSAPKPTTHRPRPNVDLKDSAAVAAAVDKLILSNLTESGTQPAPRTSDEDFLRRIHFDLAGTVPSAREVTLFGLDPDPQKREKVIERLLKSEEYSHNWAEYWRDVIFLRATDLKSRIVEGAFEKWMSDRIRDNEGWDKIVTTLLTASGPVADHGETGLIFAHGGQADELAAESSRIFLGIQIQCANCHDHPSDKWKRQQFHALA